jgi:hypothetical protein
MEPLNGYCVARKMRYFFDILNGHGFVADEEGQELTGIDAVREEALTSIRSMLSEEVSRGMMDLTGELRVRDANGAPVMALRFSDAVAVRLPHHS